MGFRLPNVVSAKKVLKRTFSNSSQDASPDVPKGYLAVYVGEIRMKRFVIPISYLKNSSFQDLLSQSQEEFGFDHPMGGLTIPCKEDIFMDLICSMES